MEPIISQPKHPFARATKAPKKKHPIYYRWLNLKNYVRNPNHPNYPIYGGKGIELYAEWDKSFNKFLLWCIKAGYRDGLVLTRRDKNKNFEPNNCFWAEHSSHTEPFNSIK